MSSPPRPAPHPDQFLLGGRLPAAVRFGHGIEPHIGRETVRRSLRAAGLVWRRPRPVLRRRDPDRAPKLAALRKLLHELPADETAVFMDEVDVNLNPKVGCQWMLRGHQASVETPGNNEKRYLAGSIHWRTGRVILKAGRGRAGRRRCSAGTWTTCGGRSATTRSSTSSATTPGPTSRTRARW